MTPPNTDSPAPTPAASAEQQQQQQQQQQFHGDPDEVDISQHYYAPQTTNRIPSPVGGGDPANISEDQLRQMMLGFDRPAPGGGAPGEPDLAEDPMMKMLQQMMGGAGGGGMPPFGGQNSPFGDGAANPFAAMGMPGMPGMGQQQQKTPQQAASDAYAAMWRVLHFLVALGLGLYIALLTSFSGSKIARERDAVARGFGGGGGATGKLDADSGSGGDDAADLRRYFFWAFATAETVLLTSRFFLDRGRAAPQGMLGTIMGFLPDSAWKGYLDVALRYSQIFSTVRSDMLVCVFVLGVCAWLRS